MKFLATTILALFLVMMPVKGWVVDFIGGIYRVESTADVTVAWSEGSGSNGTQIRIVHFFYDVREPIIEVDHVNGLQYTFSGLPKSSRHFAVEARSIRDIAAPASEREYSAWMMSTDSTYATIDGQAEGWLIYTKPPAPGGVIIGFINKLEEIGNKLVLADMHPQKTT